MELLLPEQGQIGFGDNLEPRWEAGSAHSLTYMRSQTPPTSAMEHLEAPATKTSPHTFNAGVKNEGVRTK